MSSEYRRVCEAIADLMFGSDKAGQPVYALADAGMIASFLENAGVDEQNLARLSKMVASTLELGKSGSSPFRWQVEAAERHMRSPLETPLTLPLLVLLSIAAEKMHADSALAAHNYYSRLHQILQIPNSEHSRVESDYRRSADVLWGSLNSWLEAWDGERGVPTAYSVGGHAFVGLPMSQAVVRQHDRAGLRDFFASEGMTPGLRISPADMARAMEPYMVKTPSLPFSPHLTRLWKVPETQERIVNASCLELESWDGSGVEVVPTGTQGSSARLLAFLRKFPSNSIEFNLMLPFLSLQPGVARFRLVDNEISVPTVAGPGGSTRLAGTEGVSSTSLVAERLAGSFGEEDGLRFGRMPKRVAALRWDHLHGAFVEAECLSLGEDSIVVARSEVRKILEVHLLEHARPGWHEIKDLAGLPQGWLVYEHVQILSVPTEQVPRDLIPLTPRARTSLTLEGGFALPGLLRKWSVMEPPEVIAVAAGASLVGIYVYRGTRLHRDHLIAQHVQAGELAVFPLSECDLVDGEYLVAMSVDGAGKPASTALVRLRSADTPQFRIEEVDIRLVYSPDSVPCWPLTAGPPDWPSHINGARIVGLEPKQAVGTASMLEFVPRPRTQPTSQQHTIRVGTPVTEDSCLVTGKHRTLYPTVLPGQRTSPSIEGECVNCGLLRRSAGTPWAARKKGIEQKETHIPEIPPAIRADGPYFEVAFDALNHVGAGSLGVFDRIASQVEGSGLFAETFLRRLEVLGHIDVVRDDYLQVTEWAVNSSTLVPIGSGRWVLLGSRSRSLLEKLERVLGSGAAVSKSVESEVNRIEVSGRLPIAALTELGIAVLETSPVPEIAESLPPLSELAKSLKRVVVPRHRTAELWDTATASWHSTKTLERVGAYRLKDFGSMYAIRDAEDIASGSVGIGNAQIVKHIANLWANDPLVGYNSRTGSVVAPLGADLPALYGRSLALCSGRAPREIVTHRMIQYVEVPRTIADIIFDRLSR